MSSKITFFALGLVYSASMLTAAVDESATIQSITRDLPNISDAPPQAGNELKYLDDLIAATSINLENQKALKKQLIEYMSIQKQYMQNMKDSELTYKMVKMAHQLLDKIKELHLAHVFDAQFLSELTFFSQIANKQGVPKP